MTRTNDHDQYARYLRSTTGSRARSDADQARAAHFHVGRSFVLGRSACTLLLAVSLTVWQSEPTLRAATAAAGSLVVLESWFTALGFLHRCPPLRPEGSLDDLPGRSSCRGWWGSEPVTVMLSLFWVLDGPS